MPNYPATYICLECLEKWEVGNGKEYSEGPAQHGLNTHIGKVLCTSDTMSLPEYFFLFKIPEARKEEFKNLLQSYLEAIKKLRADFNKENSKNLQCIWIQMNKLLLTYKHYSVTGRKRGRKKKNA